MRRRLLAALAALALGGSASAAEIAVTIEGTTYSPNMIKAKVGDTLIFENKGQADRMVFVATRSHAFDLGPQKPGEKRSYTIKRPGNFEVECGNANCPALKVEVTR